MTSTLQEPSLDDELTAFFAAERVADPYPLFARLRDTYPVYQFGAMTVISRYREIKATFRDAAQFQKHASRAEGLENKLSLLAGDDLVLMNEIMDFESAFLSRKNGRDHVRVRSAVSRYFTPKQIADLGHSVARMVDQLLDRTDAAEVTDLADFAYKLPLYVVMEILGAPREDADALKAWGDAIQLPQARTPVLPQDVRTAHAGLVAYREYSQELVNRHRSDPKRSVLIDALLDAAEGEQLSEHELVAFFLHTMFAGHETTANLITNGIVALLTHRQEWDRLCADPTLINSAVEELLRYDSPAQLGVRLAATDTQILGVDISRGSTVILLVGSANRDPNAFDEPDRLRIARHPNDHLALAIGPHFCLGASVARLEGRLALAALSRRFPQMDLAIDRDRLQRNRHVSLRGFEHVPVSLSP